MKNSWPWAATIGNSTTCKRCKMKKRVISTARILMILYILALAAICFGNMENLPKVHKTFLGLEWDKYVHFLMFLPFPLITYWAAGVEPANPWKAIGRTLCIFLAGCLIAAATEIGQEFLPYRSADPKDFLADAIALAVASLAVFLIMLFTGIRNSRTQ